MRISLEVFGIPDEAAERVRQAAHDACRLHLGGNGDGPPDPTLTVRGGTCPLTGRRYLSVLVQSRRPLELVALQRFSDSVFAAHPLGQEETVRANRAVRIEDSPADAAAGPGPLADKDLREEELACWVCGRFDGEEYLDPDSGASALLEVRPAPGGRVPLCLVCLGLFHPRKPIE